MDYIDKKYISNLYYLTFENNGNKCITCFVTFYRTSIDIPLTITI